MRIIEKMKEKIKNDERFIVKMILTMVLAISIPPFVGGVATCHKAVKSNPDNYTNDPQYTAGIIAVTLGTTLGAAGVAGCIGNDEEQTKDENEENNTLEK